jgi:hypothetical protein
MRGVIPVCTNISKILMTTSATPRLIKEGEEEPMSEDSRCRKATTFTPGAAVKDWETECAYLS